MLLGNCYLYQDSPVKVVFVVYEKTSSILIFAVDFNCFLIISSFEYFYSIFNMNYILLNDSVLCTLSAVLCVLSRAVLNVLDKFIFTNHKSDFFKCISLNSLLPFLLCFIIGIIANVKYENFWCLLFSLKIFLSALAAQLVAYIISYGLKAMAVKNISLATKLSDILIVTALLVVFKKYNLLDFCYAFFSTIAFIPIYISTKKKNFPFILSTTIIILFAIMSQAILNEHLELWLFTCTLNKFVEFMTCILLWRALFCLCPVFYKNFLGIQKPRLINVNYSLFMLRALLALIAQSTFFFSVNKGSHTFVWPILNSTPIISCFAASIFLGEVNGKEEKITLILLAIISLAYMSIKIR